MESTVKLGVSLPTSHSLMSELPRVLMDLQGRAELCPGGVPPGEKAAGTSQTGGQGSFWL